GGQVALNGGIAEHYRSGTARLAGLTGLAELAQGAAPEGAGFLVRPMLLGTDTAHLDESATEECFGPVTILVSYQDEADLLTALDKLPGSLTATVHLTDSDDVDGVLD